jgi:hypothetical protein
VWFLVDEQPKHVRPRVVAGDVEVELAARDLIEVDVREQDLLTIPSGPASTRPSGSMMQLPPVLTTSSAFAASVLGMSDGNHAGV